MSETRPPAETPRAGGSSEFGLPASSRIRRSGDIRSVLDRGKRKRTSSMDVFFMPSPVARPRFGSIVPKHRHRIVDRNRVRRRIREVGRLEILPRLRAGGHALDVLVRARRQAYDRDWEQLRSELIHAVEGICSDES